MNKFEQVYSSNVISVEFFSTIKVYFFIDLFIFLIFFIFSLYILINIKRKSVLYIVLI